MPFFVIFSLQIFTNYRLLTCQLIDILTKNIYNNFCMKELKKNHYIDTTIHTADIIIRTLKTELKKRVDNLNMGITSEQFVVLDTITCFENIYQQKLSEILMKDKSNTTRIIKVLEQKGFIEKELSRQNNRLVCILKATQKGKNIIKENMPRIKQFIVDIFAKIPDSEIEALQNLGNELKKNLIY